MYSKSTQKYCLQLSYFGRTLHPENLEVIQLLNEFCRIGVAYSLRNFRAKIYSVSKRRQNDGAGQVYKFIFHTGTGRCIDVYES